ncbi:MAG: T9SS type A sorting domain-containing protein [Bacteroidota bacterium]
MRKSLPLLSLLSGLILFTTVATAQQADRFAYAVTDGQQGSTWSFLRKLNLQTGEYSQVLLNGDDISVLAYDASSKKQFTAPLTDALYGNAINAPFASGVAAMAFDKKNNRLYYTPMFIDQLRYLDLKTMKVFYVTDQVFTGMPQKSSDQGNIITRMVIASDGNGYAMTNDGMHLIQFTTGKKLKIVDLGAMVDAPSNNGVSIHNSCSSFGGDMVADDDGNLYVFSARNHVFKVNAETKVATHLGVISGLPNGFTVNGAAVNDNNQVIVGSAMESSSYFTVDYKTLAATSYQIAGRVWHSSDLANSNLLVSGNKPTVTNTEIISNKIPVYTDNNKINIYPNPVLNNQFVIQFNQLEAGNYTVQVTDVTGRQAIQQAISLNGENQAQTIKLNPSASRGIYLVKVVDQNNKTVFSTKVVVQ